MLKTPSWCEKTGIPWQDCSSGHTTDSEHWKPSSEPTWFHAEPLRFTWNQIGKTTYDWYGYTNWRQYCWFCFNKAYLHAGMARDNRSSVTDGIPSKPNPSIWNPLGTIFNWRWFSLVWQAMHQPITGSICPWIFSITKHWKCSRLPLGRNNFQIWAGHTNSNNVLSHACKSSL